MVPQVVTGNSLFHSHSGSCLLPLSMLGMGFGMGNGGGIRAGGLEVLSGADFYPWGWGQGLLVLGSVVTLWGGSWTPRSWGWAVAGCIPAVTGSWEQGLWGHRKDAWGLCVLPQSSDGGKFCILCAAAVAGLGELWARQPLGPALSLSPDSWSGTMNLSCCRRVPDCPLPCDESRLPRNPLCSWGSGCGIVAEGLDWCWDSNLGKLLWGGDSWWHRGTSRALTPQNPSAPLGEMGGGGGGPNSTSL